jgi:hypothetical protein
VALSADGGVLYTLVNQRLWASDDGASSWRFSLGSELEPVFNLLIDPLDAATLYAGQIFSVSHNSGATWLPLTPNFTCGFQTLAVSPSAPSTLYAGGAMATGGPFGCRSSRPAIFRSTDGGATWTEADSGLSGFGSLGGGSVIVTVDPFDPRTVYAETILSVVPLGVWKSTDGGASWLPVGTLRVERLVFSADGGTLWGLSDSQVFASHDGAVSWQSMGGPQTFLASHLVPDPVDPDRLYAATTGGVWVLEP